MTSGSHEKRVVDTIRSACQPMTEPLPEAVNTALDRVRESIRSERERVSSLIARERESREQESARRAYAGHGDDLFDKQRNETWHEWRQRVSELNLARMARFGPLVTPEAQRHGDYRDSDVVHVETHTIAATKRNVMASPFDALRDRGAITNEQYEAAFEIARVAENMQRPVSLRVASLKARVDNSGAGRDVLIERLYQVQLEASYTRWRDRLPMPRQMILDMILARGPLANKARAHRMSWTKARNRLVAALDSWITIRDAINREIGDDEVLAVHRKLGEGALR